jgi:glycosyltransferase involved in cell wall biosynthesis
MSTAKKQSTHFLIVTPSFNQAKFIRQTLKSVFMQNHKVRYWVMDGGSKDQTQKVLRGFGKKIFWQSKGDKGQTDAINKGLEKVKTKLNDPDTIFAYINSDDYYLPGAFDAVVAAFAQYPGKQWLVGDCEIVDGKGKIIHQPIGWYKKFLRYIYFPQLILVSNPFPQPAVFIRGKAVQKVGKFNEKLRYVMDYEYWLRIQKKFGSPIFLHQKISAFRIHNQSKGGTQFHKQFAEQYKVVKSFTKNPILLLGHKIHNVLTTTTYQVIK